jgi:hypothetical protein
VNWLGIVWWIAAVLTFLASLPLLALSLTESMRLRDDLVDSHGDDEMNRSKWFHATIWMEHQRLFPKNGKRARALLFMCAYLAVLLVAGVFVIRGIQVRA